MRKFLQVTWLLVCLLLNGGVLAADEATEAALAAHAQCTIDLWGAKIPSVFGKGGARLFICGEAAPG